MKIKLKLTPSQTKAIALSSLDADVEGIYSSYRDKHRKVMIAEARLLIKRLLLSMINSNEGKKKLLNLSLFEAFTLERILRNVLDGETTFDDYTHNTILGVANELDEKLVNLHA